MNTFFQNPWFQLTSHFHRKIGIFHWPYLHFECIFLTSVKFLCRSQVGAPVSVVNVFSHGSKVAVVGKFAKSRSLKSVICWCSHNFWWPPTVPMELAWTFRGTLTEKFGSSRASLLFYSKWKSSKIAGSLLHPECYLGQTSTTESPLLVSNGLGTWRELPQGTGKVDGRSWSSILADFHGCWLFPGESVL